MYQYASHVQNASILLSNDGLSFGIVRFSSYELFMISLFYGYRFSQFHQFQESLYLHPPLSLRIYVNTEATSKLVNDLKATDKGTLNLVDL